MSGVYSSYISLYCIPTDEDKKEKLYAGWKKAVKRSMLWEEE